MAEAPQRTTQCGVCHLRKSRYICPRCNAPYCSLDCYKQHSDRCTEGFYRDSATAELKSITATDAEKRQMLEILQKLHDQQLDEERHSDSGSSSGDEAEGGLSTQTVQRLLKKLETGAEISAADLTPEELREFHRAMAAGEVSELVEPWQPWWLSEEAAQLELSEAGTTLVAPLADEPPTSLAAAPSPLPPPPSRPLPPLPALTKARPSPVLQHHLLDLLYTYCFVLQLYNGDYQTDPVEAADLVFALSGVLAAAVPGQGPAAAAATLGDSAASVLLDSISRACVPPVGNRQRHGMAVGVLSSVASILQLGRPVVLTALMDLSRLLEAARQQLEEQAAAARQGSKEGQGKDAKQLQRRLVAAERKLLFFLAWANELPAELYSLLSMAVGAELNKHLAASQGGSSSGLEIPGAAGVQVAGAAARAPAGPLVQEL